MPRKARSQRPSRARKRDVAKPRRQIAKVGSSDGAKGREPQELIAWAGKGFYTFVPAARRSAHKEALFARSAAALLDLVGDASDDVVRAALVAPTAAGTMARVVAEGVPLSAGIDQAEPLAASYARAVERKQELLNRAGRAVSASRVGALLGGISRQAVDKRRKEGKLLAIRTASGDYRYPSAQFTPDGGVVPHLDEWLRVCAFRDPWMQLQLLVGEPETLRGNTVRDALASSDPTLVDEAMRVARTAGEQGA